MLAEKAILKVEQIYKQADTILEKMKSGDRVKILDLAEQVSNVLSLDKNDIYSILKIYMEEVEASVLFKVKRGAKGGIYRL